MKKQIFFYGIGGISMSALAHLSSPNNTIWGYDDNPENYVQLKNCAIKTCDTLDFEIIKKCDLVVYTCAIKEITKLRKFCSSHNIQLLERAEYLGELSKLYRQVLAISGTHGKTTTTAMIGSIFNNAHLSPTIHMGGISNEWQQNYLLGNTDYFITEACEYNKSFLHLFPSTSVILNIEADHLDTYTNFAEIKSTFIQFANQTKQNLVICGDSLDKKSFNTPNIVTFGFKKTNDVFATNLMQNNACFSFDCIAFGKNIGKFSLNIMGKHNILNALASITVGLIYQIPVSTIQNALKSFLGGYRRLTLLAKTKLGTHYHDYAHHPTEIKATLDSLNCLAHKKLIAVFQPHTYTRTHSLMDEFVTCFDNCDYLYILPTYPAREKYIAGGDAIDLFYNMNGRVDCQYFSNIESLYYELEKNLCPHDIIVWLGAGDIDKFAKEFVQKNKP